MNLNEVFQQRFRLYPSQI